MSNLRRFQTAARTLLVASAISLSGVTAIAQNSSEVTALYGRAVHAFFAGRTAEAEQMLTECIEAGSQDPRVYYFRGIARLQQCRDYEAEEDLRIGASLEARDPGMRYGIGNALQRIQGPERIALEKFRRAARVQRVQERRSLNQYRYEDLRIRESDVLHHGQPIPLEQMVEPSVEVQRSGTVVPTVPPTQPVLEQPSIVEEPAAATETSDEGLFGPTEVPAVEAPVTQQPAPAPATESDPFGAAAEPAEPVEDPAPAEEAPAADDDLFGPSDEPAPAPVEETPATTDEATDPFGATEAPAAAGTPATPPQEVPADTTEADPFGAPADTEAAEAETTEEELTESETVEDATEFPAEPAAAEPAPPEADEAAGEDPFGADASEGEAPAEDSTEAATEDPFGGTEASESEEPAAEDPFGAGATESESEDTTEDPFGGPAESTDEGEAESGESAEEAESSDGETDEEPVADDPFGGVE